MGWYETMLQKSLAQTDIYFWWTTDKTVYITTRTLPVLLLHTISVDCTSYNGHLSTANLKLNWRHLYWNLHIVQYCHIFVYSVVFNLLSLARHCHWQPMFQRSFSFSFLAYIKHSKFTSLVADLSLQWLSSDLWTVWEGILPSNIKKTVWEGILPSNIKNTTKDSEERDFAV